VETILHLFESEEGNGHYCLELSEQQILGDPAHLRESVAALRRSGIRISVDDVGFGRSSLEGLVVLEPEVVKIDRRYVLGIAHDPAKRRSFQRLLGVARSLEATVIAEGLEKEADVEALRDLGVRFGQGFLLGEPSAVPEA
jgi:EAL domain-containing protein (putative c-di-GMP-specific phosphodiesterase class I)